MVKPPLDESQASGWVRFRSCSSCGFHFCSFCRHTWYAVASFRSYVCSSHFCRHGPLAPCPDSLAKALVLEYLDLPEGSDDRKALESRFGKGLLRKLVKDYTEEKLSSDMVEGTTTPCPGCKVRVEKSVGCNHVRVFSLHFVLSYHCHVDRRSRADLRH